MKKSKIAELIFLAVVAFVLKDNADTGLERYVFWAFCGYSLIRVFGYKLSFLRGVISKAKLVTVAAAKAAKEEANK